MAKKPTFKMQSGHGKVPIYAGFERFCPLAHFYFQLNVIKKLIIYNSMPKKSGFLGREYILMLKGD
jgi:hypothetical protein